MFWLYFTYNLFDLKISIIEIILLDINLMAAVNYPSQKSS